MGFAHQQELAQQERQVKPKKELLAHFQDLLPPKHVLPLLGILRILVQGYDHVLFMSMELEEPS